MFTNLNYCFNQKKIVSFYCDKNNTNLHLTGYIGCLDVDEVLIYHITQYGKYDGYILKHMCDIYRIDYDGQYEKTIEKAYRINEQSHRKVDISCEGILYSLLDFAKKNSLIISLEFQDSTISGFINKYDNDVVSINIIDDNGIINGISTINLDEIVSFGVDTEDEQYLNMLYKSNIQ